MEGDPQIQNAARNIAVTVEPSLRRCDGLGTHLHDCGSGSGSGSQDAPRCTTGKVDIKSVEQTLVLQVQGIAFVDVSVGVNQIVILLLLSLKLFSILHVLWTVLGLPK